MVITNTFMMNSRLQRSALVMNLLEITNYIYNKPKLFFLSTSLYACFTVLCLLEFFVAKKGTFSPLLVKSSLHLSVCLLSVCHYLVFQPFISSCLSLIGEKKCWYSEYVNNLGTIKDICWCIAMQYLQIACWF